MSRKLDILVVGIALAVVSKPNIGINIGPAILRPIDIVVVLTLIAASSYLVLNSEITISNYDLRIIAPLVTLIVLACITITHQKFSIGNSIVDMIELSELIIFYISMRILFSNLNLTGLERIAYAIVIWTVFSSFLGIVIFVLENVRLVYVPYVVGLPVFSAFYLSMKYFETNSYKYAAFFGIVLLRVLFTQSRSIWIAMAGAVILGLLIEGRLSLGLVRARAKTIVLGTLLPVVLSIIIFPGLLSRFASLVRGNQFLFARPVIYLAGFQQLLEYPMGVGLGNYTTAIQTAAQQSKLAFPNWFISFAGDNIIDYTLGLIQAGEVGAHSDFVLFFVELGLVGLIVFVIFWIQVYRTVRLQNSDAMQRAFGFTLLYFGLQSIINSYLVVRGDGLLIILMLAFAVTAAIRTFETSSKKLRIYS